MHYCSQATIRFMYMMNCFNTVYIHQRTQMKYIEWYTQLAAHFSTLPNMSNTNNTVCYTYCSLSLLTTIYKRSTTCVIITYSLSYCWIVMKAFQTVPQTLGAGWNHVPSISSSLQTLQEGKPLAFQAVCGFFL